MSWNQLHHLTLVLGFQGGKVLGTHQKGSQTQTIHIEVRKKSRKMNTPHDEIYGDATPEDFDSAKKSMPKEEVPISNNIKFDLDPYCPICTPMGYKCVCKDEEADWDGTVVTYHPVPRHKSGSHGSNQRQ